ncbi:response regulator [Actinomadura verrucosospora]|uniref:Two component LuxR family transcriptional regulator n=1 Tax=Actinomadura verrucosospora TaxID=46165 RepID=A0A7D3VQV7_ACTVE|nr:response regulator transcription factor [Actinomadura verrucosospora]QKG19979.1 two component LuxR family transcriptional regulator [Actinomadura verrucosospora]
MIGVLLVDDQPLLRMGFRLVLEAHPDITVVGEAGDGAQAVAQAAALAPDVVLMDVRMPGTDGIEATELITRDHPSSRVLVLTTFDLDEHAFAALRAGAAGFLLKNVEPAALIAGIRTVAAGDGVVAPRLTRLLIEAFAERGPAARPGTTRDPRLERLTGREGEVLAAVGRGRSNAEIAEELELSEATVKTHVSRILHKPGLRDRVQAAVLAYETGLLRPR